MKSILIIDDEEALLKALERFLKDQGYEVIALSDWQKGLGLLRERSFDLLIVDLMLPQVSGIEVLLRYREVQPNLISIVMTGYGTIPSAVEAIRAGAYHYVTKPFDLEDIASLVSKALEHSQLKEENRFLRRQLKEKYGFDNIVGQSAKMNEIFRLVEKISDTDSTVMITGESGTGKELLAKAIHFHSRRSEKPFVAVNCAAIPEGLLESELFGHVKGAFTGAVTTRPGRFESADRGTIFLDEIGDMSPQLQVKVLRVLQDRRFEPVGSSKTREVDIRIITATNQYLAEAVAQDHFREDLFYRLNVIPIHLPPLRERREDLPLLVEHFLRKHSKDRRISGFSPEVIELFQGCRWPGNVGELEHLIERLIVFQGSGEIGKQDLPAPFYQEVKEKASGDRLLAVERTSFRELVSLFETDLIRKALDQTGGNKNKAAQLLKLNRTTLIEKMKRMPKDAGGG